MVDNTDLLRDLLSRNAIRLKNSEVLRQRPTPLPAAADFDKVEGMLLGLAIGDALGATSEGIVPNRRRELHGEIRDYLPGRRSRYRRVGVATDDTQLAFWTLEQLVADRGLVPDNLARAFCHYRIRGIGNTTKEFIRNYKDRHLPWDRAGIDSLGNGALMRIAPVLVPYIRRPSPSMYADAAINAMTTHNNFANTATCVAFVRVLWCLMGMNTAPDPEWWLETMSSAIRELEGNETYVDHDKPLWRHARDSVQRALRRKLSVLEACDEWHSGASLFETLPSVLYILMIHANSAQEAIVRAVNDTKDNDTIAAIVGAAVGALHGSKVLPEDWVDGLVGKTRMGDEGNIFKVILRARRVFWDMPQPGPA